ncbi:hypothetical protein D3C72_1825100 [compost metagenome]
MQTTDLGTMQPFHAVSNRSQHAFDLMVLPFRQGQAQGIVPHADTSRRLDWLGVIIQYYPFQQSVNLLLGYSMLGNYLVHLGHMLFRRTHTMNELTIVAQKQHARRVLIETPDRLHTLNGILIGTIAQWRWQQGIDTRIGRWLLRAFRSSGLVQQNIA